MGRDTGGGKVIDFAAFKARKLDSIRTDRGKEQTPPTTKDAHSVSNSEAVVIADRTRRYFKEHVNGPNCACLACRFERQGIPLTAATEKLEIYETSRAAGTINPRILQDWVKNLRQESFADVISRLLTLDKHKLTTNPTYYAAVVRVAKEKLHTELK